jgi:GTPase SAR1 family protein
MSLLHKMHTFWTDSQEETTSLEYKQQEQAISILSQAIDGLENFPVLQQHLETLKNQVYRPLQVAVVGEYNAGKSTFLNAILEDSVLPTGNLPTTGCVNYIRYGKFSIVVHYKNGSSEAVDPVDLQRISTHDHDNPEYAYQLQQLKYIEVFKESKILEEIVFVDTPGLNAPTEADREITEELLGQSDAIIWLTSARKVLAATEIETLELFGDRYKGKSLCVISQIDDLNNPKKEVPLLLKHANKTLSNYFSNIVAISALEAIEGNEEMIRPFYTAFWQDIVPRSREIVAQTILLDSRNLLKNAVNELNDGIDRLDDLSEHIEFLKDNAYEITESLLEKTNKASDKAARSFHQVQDRLITKIQYDATTWTDYEPYTKTIEGIFVDDYVVDYKEVTRWEWGGDSVEESHNWIISETAAIVQHFSEECDKAYNKTSSALELINNDFKEKNKDIINDADLNTSTQHCMMLSQFRNYTENIQSYFNGAISHGGVYPINWGIFLDKSTSRPTASRATELIKAFLPLERLKNYLTEERQEFETLIETAIISCYEWLENNNNEKIEQVSSLIEQLEDIKDSITLDDI